MNQEKSINQTVIRTRSRVSNRILCVSTQYDNQNDVEHFIYLSVHKL